MQRSETKEVSFADDGSPSPFERLCEKTFIHWLEYYPGDELVITVTNEADDDIMHIERMTTDAGEPIPFATALELAASFLLARLE